MSCSDADNTKLISDLSGMMCVLTGWVWSSTGYSIRKAISGKSRLLSPKENCCPWTLSPAIYSLIRWGDVWWCQDKADCLHRYQGRSDSKTLNLVLVQLFQVTERTCRTEVGGISRTLTLHLLYLACCVTYRQWWQLLGDADINRFLCVCVCLYVHIIWQVLDKNSVQSKRVWVIHCQH